MYLGAKEMAKPSRVLTAPAEDTGSVPSSHMAAHNLQHQPQGSQCPFLASACTQCTGIRADQTLIHIIKQFFNSNPYLVFLKMKEFEEVDIIPD